MARKRLTRRARRRASQGYSDGIVKTARSQSVLAVVCSRFPRPLSGNSPEIRAIAAFTRTDGALQFWRASLLNQWNGKENLMMSGWLGKVGAVCAIALLLSGCGMSQAKQNGTVGGAIAGTMIGGAVGCGIGAAAGSGTSTTAYAIGCPVGAIAGGIIGGIIGYKYAQEP